MAFRRLWKIHVDDRSREIGWILGSKVFRSRVESGLFGGYLHYDLAVPYNEGREVLGYTVGLPEVVRGIPTGGKILQLTDENGNDLFLEFWFENLGVPGSLYCELIHTLGVSDAKEDKSHGTKVAGKRNPERRRGDSQGHLQRQAG